MKKLTADFEYPFGLSVTDAQWNAMKALGYGTTAGWFVKNRSKIDGYVASHSSSGASSPAAIAAATVTKEAQAPSAYQAAYVPNGITGPPAIIAAMQVAPGYDVDPDSFNIGACTSCSSSSSPAATSAQVYPAVAASVAAASTSNASPAGAIDLNGPLVNIDAGAVVVLGVLAWFLFFRK